MVLQSCQEEISDLFSFARSWVNPNHNYIKAAKYLSNLDLIKIQEMQYIICSHKQDTLDWLNVTDQYCKNEILIDENFDEGCENIICENCNRDILPNTYKKQRFYRLSVHLNPEKIMEWLESQLNDSNFMWHKEETGVYYVGGQGKIVNLIIPDFCTNPIFLTIDRIRIHPTVLITLRKNISDVPFKLPIIKMVDLFCKRKALVEIFQEAIKRGVPELIPNISLQILPTAYVSLKYVEPIVVKKPLELKVIESRVYVNDIEIINKKAGSCLNVFRVLFRQFLHDCGKELPPTKHTLLSINQLEKSLNLSLEADLEHQIRKPLNTMQRTIKATLAKKLGLNIERNDVIQTVGWPGSSCRDYGYRINPFNVVIKVAC